MAKVCVIGAFRLGHKPKGGQEIKTVILADALEQRYGKIYRIDTLSENSRFKMPFQIVRALMTCNNIIMLPAHNGVRVLSKFLTKLNIIFKRRLHYSVIGGWLQDLLLTHVATAKALMKFDGIYVETSTMKEALLSQGFHNVHVVSNCKPLEILNSCMIVKTPIYPLKFVTFSRVTEKKGIGTAVKLIKKINERFGKTVLSLDIYGPVDKEDEIWFDELKREFTSAISYKGNVSFDNTTKLLSSYFALLFPTQYFTEGIPGTIIDAYAAGLPVLASRWKSFDDVVVDGVTGFGYEFDNESRLYELLIRITEYPQSVYDLRKNCLIKAREYLPENALKPIFNLL